MLPPPDLAPPTRDGSVASPDPGGVPTTPEVPFADLPSHAGRYRIEGEIARGGMGVVLRAEDAGFGRTLAVKLMASRLVERPDLEQRFLDEARLTAQLQHPGIPPVHDQGTLDDGRPFFAMKLIRGRTLTELLKERSSPTDDLPRFLSIFSQVCATLAYAHSRGVIHRDLKPSNVMVGAFGEVQVMDWGLAKSLASGGCQPLDSRAARREPAGEPPAGSRPAALEPDQTQAGTVIGTPGYMAPEQARGEIDHVDERADVFGLGALLCEILSTQPPFRGGSTPEVFRQTVQGDLSDALDRLDASGADPELFALAKACLAPRRDDRPRNADAVARAVTAYQAGVQERLRLAELERAQVQVRAIEERKRRRLRLGLVTSGLVVLALGIGSVALWQRQRSERDEAFNIDLDRVAELRNQARWDEARQTWEQARNRLNGGGTHDQQQRLEQARSDLERADRLNSIRLDSAVLVEGSVDLRNADREYERAFREWGLGGVGDRPSEVAARVRSSGVKAQLVTALEVWAVRTTGPGRRAWLLTVAQQADPDPGLKPFRDPNGWTSLAAVRQLARAAESAPVSPQLLIALAMSLEDGGDDPVPLLREAQARHPDDFWVNVELGRALVAKGLPGEALGFYGAALAIRPRTGVVHNNLGVALKRKGDLKGALAAHRKAVDRTPRDARAHFNLGVVLKDVQDLPGAIAAYRKAIALNANYAQAHTNLGIALAATGDRDGAIVCYQKALQLDATDAVAHSALGNALQARGDLKGAVAAHRQAIKCNPRYALGHFNLGYVLHKQGKVPEAIAAYKESLRHDPQYPAAHFNLGHALKSSGDLPGAVAAYRKAIEHDPKYAQAYTNLGSVLHASGDLPGAIDACTKAVELDPKDTLAHFNLGNALYSKGDLPAALVAFRKALDCNPRFAPAHANLGNALRLQGNLPAALAAYRKAIACDPKCSPAYFNLGSLAYGKGDLPAAAAAFRQAIEHDPKYSQAHGALGETLLRQGQFADARAALRRCLELLPASDPRRQTLPQRMRHCEALLALDAKLTAVLQGKQKPADAIEALNLAWLCQQPYKRRFATAARFYADAFAEQPKLADNIRSQSRYHAAGAAAQAASGQAADADKLDEGERLCLRSQAYDWLQADLRAWARAVRDGPPQARRDAQRFLALCLKDAALSRLRESASLAQLPAEEEAAWCRFWADVEALLAGTREPKLPSPAE